MTNLTVLSEIDPLAKVAPEAQIGPYCVIGPNVTIGPGTALRRRVCVYGNTIVGSGNVFEEGCVIGDRPQDLKYKGGPTMLMIGHRNFFGRRVTAHLGTEDGGGLTRVGDDNYFGEGSHIAHDCFISNRTRLGRHVLLAGHICVETGAVMEALSGAHHFVTIGRYCRIGSRTAVRRDVPPYTDFFGSGNHDSPAGVRGIHEAGIAAARLSPDEQRELRHCLGELFIDRTALETKIEHLEKLGVEGEAAKLCEFCRRSLKGVYGRYRELLRGQAPPEAAKFLPPQLSNLWRQSR